MINTTIVDNFFDNFENIKDSFKNIKMYDNEEYNKHFENNGKWPGFRSQDLYDSNKFLWNLIVKEFEQKFNNPLRGQKYWFKCYTHLRLENMDDWIHTDPNYATLMVYLSNTNLKSGTCLYNENKELTTTVNFVQNRAFLCNGKTNHMSLNNHGTDINNGRLTLNCFIYLE
jgi:hypothetical protein